MVFYWLDRLFNYFGYYADETVYADKAGPLYVQRMGTGMTAAGPVRFRAFVSRLSTFTPDVLDAVVVRPDGSAFDATDVVRSFAGPRSDFFGAAPIARWFSHVLGEPVAELQVTYKTFPRAPVTYMPYDTVRAPRTLPINPPPKRSAAPDATR